MQRSFDTLFHLFACPVTQHQMKKKGERKKKRQGKKVVFKSGNNINHSIVRARLDTHACNYPVLLGLLGSVIAL